GGDEIVAGYGLAVVAAEVFVEPFPKALAPQQRLLHANDFRTLFIDGGGIEVGDFLIAFGPDRVRHGARVFGELGDAQCRDIVDTLDGPGAGGRGPLQAVCEHVGRELLIAEYGQPFLERELKPVAAGDAVACPVVEVLMPDYGLDRAVGRVGGRGRIGQYVGRVEDVQALVLHGAHIEVARSHDHEAVKVQFQAIARFVPADGANQAVHGPFGTVLGAVVAVHLQQHLAPAAGGDAFFTAGEIARHHGKEVAGLGMRVFPYRFVTAVAQVALRQDRKSVV